MPLRNFLFDLDGTLADSAPLHASAFRRVLTEAAPRALDVFDYEQIKGLSTRESFRRLGIPEGPGLDRCVAHKQRFYREAIGAGFLREFPAARRALHAVLERGGSNYLVTSGSGESVREALAALDLAGLLSGIVTSDEAARGKPSPEPYLECMRRFDLRTDESIAIEDARAGVSSARAAGLLVIGVNNEHIAAMVEIYFPAISAFADQIEIAGLQLTQP